MSKIKLLIGMCNGHPIGGTKSTSLATHSKPLGT